MLGICRACLRWFSIVVLDGVLPEVLSCTALWLSSCWGRRGKSGCCYSIVVGSRSLSLIPMSFLSVLWALILCSVIVITPLNTLFDSPAPLSFHLGKPQPWLNHLSTFQCQHMCECCRQKRHICAICHFKSMTRVCKWAQSHYHSHLFYFARYLFHIFSLKILAPPPPSSKAFLFFLHHWEIEAIKSEVCRVARTSSPLLPTSGCVPCLPS